MLSNNFKKYIKSLHQRKFRQKYNKIQVDGSKSCIEVASQIPNAIDTVICTQSWLNSVNVPLPDCELLITSPDEVNLVSQLDHNTQVSMIIDMDYSITSNYSDEWAIYLDDVQDPGNVGTIIRLADWYGISTVYASPHSAKVDNPKVIQASMGGFTRVKSVILAQEDLIANQDKPIIIADLDGSPIKSIESMSGGILVIGNEGKGISAIFNQGKSLKVTIPGYGRAESLNASVSCGIILSHLL
jgi:TrmH family RNA methyltransferase